MTLCHGWPCSTTISVINLIYIVRYSMFYFPFLSKRSSFFTPFLWVFSYTLWIFSYILWIFSYMLLIFSYMLLIFSYILLIFSYILLIFFLYPLDFFLFFMIFPWVFPLVFLGFVLPVDLCFGFGLDLGFFFFPQVFLQCCMVTFFVLHLFFFRLLHVFAIHCFWQFLFCTLLIQPL